MRVTRRWFRTFWAITTLLLAAFVLYESTRSAGDPTLPDVSTGLSYAGHFVTYAALGFCAQTAVARRNVAAIVCVAAAAGIFGAAIEAYQSTLEGREASFLDALANLAGAAAGAWLAVRLLPHWEHLLMDDASAPRT